VDYSGRRRRPTMHKPSMGIGATFNEWGRFLERILEYDPAAIAGDYAGLSGFRDRHGREFVVCRRRAA
jgi:hypothetical protein